MGIVVEHSMLIYGYPREHEMIWGMFISWLMPLFTFISGYLYRERTMRNLAEKYIHPMILFSAVNFFVGYWFYEAYHHDFHIFGYAMWYLWALFWFAIITPYVSKVFSMKALLVFSLVLVIIYQVLPVSSSISYIATKLQIGRIIGFYPFFLLGIISKRLGYTEISSVQKTRTILSLIMVGYLLMCYFQVGFAYKSGFYLLPSSGWRTVVSFALSYPIIMLLCILLVSSMPRKETFLSRYGGLTLNVYLLHMTVVFPLCYGVFSHFEYNILVAFLNSFLACIFCTFFFTRRVGVIIQRMLECCTWKIAIPSYLLALVLVNSSTLLPLINKWIDF